MVEFNPSVFSRYPELLRGASVENVWGPLIRVLSENDFKVQQDLKKLATLAGSGGSGSVPSFYEDEIDFGSVPVYEKTITITGTSVSVGSVISIQESGKIGTGRGASGDSLWDSINFTCYPATTSATIFAKANPGPVVGKRKFLYILN